VPLSVVNQQPKIHSLINPEEEEKSVKEAVFLQPESQLCEDSKAIFDLSGS